MKLICCTLQFILTGLSLWWLTWDLDWSQALRRCSNVSIVMLIAVFLQRFIPYIMLGARLAVLFPSLSIWTGFKSSVLCVACNTIFPARLGELVKIVWLHGRSVLPYSILCNGVLWERLQDVSMLLLLSLIFAQPLLNIPVIISMGLTVGIVWISLLLLAFPRSPLRRWLLILSLSSTKRNWITRISTVLEECINQKKNFFGVLLGTVLVWSMNFWHVALLANFLMDLKLSWCEIGVLCVTIFFSSALMLAPGGVGVMEAAIVTTLSLLGVDKNLALSTAIFARLYYSIPPLLGAITIVLFSGQDIASSISGVYHSLKKLRKNRWTTREKNI